jgi:hypothetical protein
VHHIDTLDRGEVVRLMSFSIHMFKLYKQTKWGPHDDGQTVASSRSELERDSL